ncbi:hypothetical protein CAPTEDRAFT_39625, partial [Capitella teleta]
CASCHGYIRDRNIHEAFGRHWHRKCLRCTFCRTKLDQMCYMTARGKLCCRKDHHRLSQVSCASCDVIIARGVPVHRVMGNIYHKRCFRCTQCGDQFKVGSHLY